MNMSTSLYELPLEERLRIVEDLWDSIAADSQTLPLSEAHKEVLEQRLSTFKQDGNKGRPADEILAEIKTRKFPLPFSLFFVRSFIVSR